MYKILSSRAARRLAQKSPVSQLSRRSVATFDWKDPLGAQGLYTEEETAIAETAEQYCQEKLLPRVLGMLPIRTPIASYIILTRYSQRPTEKKNMTSAFSKKWVS